MSETATRRRIRAQGLPRDPRTMRFILEAPVQPGRPVRFDGPDAAAPLSGALFAIAGVRRVQVADETIVITLAEGRDWQALKAQAAAAIREVLDRTDRPLGDAAGAASAGEDAALLEAVNELLDRGANPSIAGHGGRVTAEHVADGVVHLRMSGGCQGCAAASVTLHSGVEAMLRAALPGIREIVDVTDHASGTDPYYRDVAGQSPAIARMVPAGALRWRDGRLAIDPAYLAPRLGLRPAQLLAGLARGEIVTETEWDGDGTTAVRVTVRTPHRDWVAEILPEGGAREVPSPPDRAPEGVPDMLAERIRGHLAALPPDRLPITYGGLARALGIMAPGAIRRVTDALEATMRADAKAARPFIAARVVGRGSGNLPGRGFFELARTLGRGQRPDETEQAFHLRELREGLRA